MLIELCDPGKISKTLEVASSVEALLKLEKEGQGYTSALGPGFSAWRPLGGGWKYGSLCAEVRAARVALGLGDPGLLNTAHLRDLHDDGLTVEEIARRV